MQHLQEDNEPGRNQPGNAPDKDINMLTMNDEGDIQLVDDMQMFSHHESARYDEDREGDELEYQTNDIEDSSRIRLMPPHRDNTFHLDDHYEEKEPLSL